MGSFNDDDEAPSVQFTPYKPLDAASQNPPINFMKVYDNISGQEFVFKKSPTGERYLQLKKLIDEKQNEYNRLNEPKSFKFHNLNEARSNQLKNEIDNLESEASKLQFTAGDTTIETIDRSGRLPLDAPFESVIPEVANLSNVQDLPHMQQMVPYIMRYAAAVSDLTDRMRNLGNTIEGLEMTDPMTVARYQPFIQAFKQANKLAMDKGFDIKQNGLDNKLREMGLNNSTTALGVAMSLQKQRVDTEIENNLKEYSFANNLKQESIKNLIDIGTNLNKEGLFVANNLAQMNQDQLNYRQQQVTQRGQDVQLEQLKQNKAAIERQSELDKRKLTLQMLMDRDPMKMGLNFIANNNTNAVNAIGVTNTGLAQLGQNQINASMAEIEKFKADQAAQSNPLQSLLTTGVSTLAGAYTGGLGTALGLKHGGVDPNNITKKI